MSPEDTAAMELEAARGVFERLGAKPDLARLASLGPIETPVIEAHGLSARELEVLRLAAAGQSNRAIADELVISEHTVARHLQNILRQARGLLANRSERLRIRARPRLGTGGQKSSLTGTDMYAVVQHKTKDPQVAFPRGERMIKGEGAPGAGGATGVARMRRCVAV